ncbi:2-isopropylmalate synthase [Oharaeibacter diazotrophicus]|uniref:2-isopropylmalate synthase n=1 Tax=Oharaeibacter diazotrophicus TaxID=1920512 RepID=A0A4R6RGU7_9HYPH|nr:2-isopropylmalate synthase [Oharaeibacter diazotrophicus]TDP85629.1 2-isopropylmalate synthase [Oharaeibacter diazotrophicus]BBE74595.1 2-isopropylmalate synthase [Pleomorphomonas sp. SM30]GLS75700.1 2-isopropylmalate synthase [Oharaeibacter diazotrophicus]
MNAPVSAPKDRIVIFDTTLRDGEQSPGASMTLSEKLQVAEVLDEMGVDVIEAGFPIASNGDFEAVSEIAKRVKNATVCGLARASNNDIDRAGEAVKHAEKRRIHTFISTSPLHMKYKLQMEPETVYEKVIASVTRARQWTDDVEWSAEDGSRTEHDFLCRCVEAAIKAGATTINIPDTVGYAVPEEYAALFQMLLNRVPNADKAIFSTHCHDDLGLAVANSLAGISGGARQIECTINGLGERAGNAALEEVVMAIRTRADVLPFATGIKTPMLTRASKLVSNASAFPVQYNKAIVGQNAFAHESGIHQDGMLKNAQTYEIMRPDDVGVKSTSLVMGKHSGRHAFKEKLKDLGIELGDNALEDAFRRFKDLADKKKHVFDEDIEALVSDEMENAGERVKVMALTVIAGTAGPQMATITLDVDGTHVTMMSNGDGPVDATFNAIKKIIPHEATLRLYQVSAVTEGTDAQAEVFVRLEEGGKQVTGKAADTDTLVSSAKAYISALNKLYAKRDRANAREVAAV